jgi:hypothetical protein
MSIANGTVARFTNACEMYISRPITMETELLQTIYALTAEVRATNQLLSARNKQ